MIIKDTKTRLLAVEQLIKSHDRGLTLKEIISHLDNEFNIYAKRKTIYSDLNALTRFYNVQTKRVGRHTYYHIEEME